MFSSILTLDHVNMDDEGKFKVVLKNELGEVMSATQVNVKQCMYICSTKSCFFFLY